MAYVAPQSDHALKPLPLSRLAKRIGVDLSALPELLAPAGEPWMLHAELIARHGWTSEKPCPGMLIDVDRTAPLWVAECNTCRFEIAHPADTRTEAARLLERAQLPQRFLKRPYRRDESPVNRVTRNALWAWFEQENLTPCPALYGRPGVGKTHLSVVVLRELITRRQTRVMFRTAPQLLSDLQAAIGTPAYEQMWQAAIRVPLLALDDLGAEMDTDWKADRIAALIDERYRADLPMSVTTNVNPDRWNDALDARTASRLREMTFPLELIGEDRRSTSAVQSVLAAVPAGDWGF